MAAAAGTPIDAGLSTSFGGSEDVTKVVVHLPAGLVGNPNAVPKCPQATFANPLGELQRPPG